MSNFIKIDSATRNYPLTTNASNCKITSKTHVFQGTYGLKLAYVPLTFYNITAQNNVVYFTDSGGAHVTVIPIGFYDSNTIMTAVATGMSASSAAAVYTATKAAVTRNITIAASTGVFVLNFSNTANSIAVVLGFIPQDTSSSSTQTALTISNMSMVRSLNFSINNIAGMDDLTGQGSSTFIIPVEGNSLSIQVYEPNTFLQQITFDTPTRDLSIVIYDDNHQVINMQEDYFIVLQKY